MLVILVCRVSLSRCVLRVTLNTGSHIVLTLLLTRRIKVISIDNNHNSHPLALSRVSKIAWDALPPDASEQDKDSAQVDVHRGNLTNVEDVSRVFEQYGKGGIWGVIHVAVSLKLCETHFFHHDRGS